MIRKTALVTAGSIAGVVLAGGIAVGANIGILNAADATELGTLSADAPATTVPSQTDPTDNSTDGSLNHKAQPFEVDNAGTVIVEVDDDEIHLSEVQPEAGWSWLDASPNTRTVTVTFDNGSDHLEFTAQINDDGTISASVDRPARVPAASTSTVTGNDNHYDDDDNHDDEEDDDDRYDAEDDDDHDEHEGRYDDD